MCSYIQEVSALKVWGLVKQYTADEPSVYEQLFLTAKS